MFKRLIEILTGDSNRSKMVRGFLIGAIVSQIVVSNDDD